MDKIDQVVEDVMDPLFADRFVEAVSKSLIRGVDRLEQQEWLTHFLRGIEDRIWKTIQKGEWERFLASRRRSALPEDQPDYLEHLQKEAERHFAETAN
jgi:hypothetical protein